MIIQKPYAELSEGAQHLYHFSEARGGTIQGHDWDSSHYRRGVVPDPTFVQELVDAGYASAYEQRDNGEPPYIWTTSVRPNYVHHESDPNSQDGFYVEVYLVDGDYGSRGSLLATMRGAEVQVGERGPNWRIVVRDYSMYDCDHDPVRLADFSFWGPTIQHFLVNKIEFCAMLSQAAMFFSPLDPTMKDVEECEWDYCEQKPKHYIVGGRNDAPPVRKDLVGHQVRVVCTPARLVDHLGRFVQD